jgi:hypothetical protein
VWLLIDRAFIASLVFVHLSAGTFFLINGFPNYFVAVGAAIWFYAHALRWSLGLRHLQARLRIECLANVLAGSLCAIGSVLHGGPIGVLGAIGSLVWVTTWLWALKTFWSLELEPTKPAGP